MTQQGTPPCPDELLRKLREPARFDDAREGRPEPGTVWDVRAPDGEVLLCLIVQRFEEGQAAPFAFVRAVPLSDFVRLTGAGDVIVAIDSSGTILAAHCWLEGPVLPEALVRCLGSASPASMRAVAKARALTRTGATSARIAAFRESLYEQFDPLFAACWQKLYASVGDEESEGTETDELGEARTIPFVRPDRAQAREYAVAASDGTQAAATIADAMLAYLNRKILREILSHSTQKDLPVWFLRDGDGWIPDEGGHTFDQAIADAHPFDVIATIVPLLPESERIIEPDREKLIAWLEALVGDRRVAEHIVSRI